ncbi:MAG: hypothetical protein GY928_33715 [Colwellia sp.]|nr:hypothetical protein [Colwellia sp.]
MSNNMFGELFPDEKQASLLNNNMFFNAGEHPNVKVLPPIQLINQWILDVIKRKCKKIYQPTGAALEYWALCLNPYHFCGYCCSYCYVPGVRRQKRAWHNQPGVLGKGLMKELESDLLVLQNNGITGLSILITFLSDPWHLGDSRYTSGIIQMIHEYGHFVNCLTKSGNLSLRDRGLFGKGDRYGASLTLASHAMSKKFEKKAAMPDERINALIKFSEVCPTWVSLEPVILPSHTLKNMSIDGLADAVEVFKVGKVNRFKGAPPVNWAKFTKDVIKKAIELGTVVYIKSSLHEYVPAEYLKHIQVHAPMTGWQPTESLSGIKNGKKSSDYVNALIALSKGEIVQCANNALKFRVVEGAYDE